LLFNVDCNEQLFSPELKSPPKSSRPRRDIEVTRLRRDRDFEQKVKTRPRLERTETETRHETFKIKCLQNLRFF